MIALSGVYDARFVGENLNDEVIYQNSPADYIWNQNDGWFIDRYRQADIIVCTGLGDQREQDGLPPSTRWEAGEEYSSLVCWMGSWCFMTGFGGVSKRLISLMNSIFKGGFLWIILLFLPIIHKSQQFTVELANRITVLGIGHMTS